VECLAAAVVAAAGADLENLNMRTKLFVLIVALSAPLALAAVPKDQQSFKTPEAAVTALVKAAQAKDTKALVKLLGPLGKPLVDSGDPVADQNARARFLESYKTAHSLDKSEPAKATLEVGVDKWPFPIPITSSDGLWYWDSAEGAEEVINRRVGENELATIQSCLAYVDAQQEYYLRNVGRDPLQHYANKLISSEGKKDGLYWPTTGDEAPSPLGEEFAAARAEGYLQGSTSQGAPYHGYIYRLLTRQGSNAQGGAYDYVVNGEFLGGFALIAFPAEYGSSGVMTFIVNHEGVVYSRDLGPDTAKAAMAIKEFNPDSMWKKEDGTVLAAQ
jgi:hypothetical protein